MPSRLLGCCCVVCCCICCCGLCTGVAWPELGADEGVESCCNTLGTALSHCDTSGVLVNFRCFLSARLGSSMLHYSRLLSHDIMVARATLAFDILLRHSCTAAAAAVHTRRSTPPEDSAPRLGVVGGRGWKRGDNRHCDFLRRLFI